jgi:hypothetical protein
MAPTRGSIHARARCDSGVARLWQWARTRRAPWTCLDAADAAAISSRRMRAIVGALAAAGLVDCVRESELDNNGQKAAEWTLSVTGTAMREPPILIVTDGAIVGVRMPGDDSGTAMLRRALARSGLSTRAAARRLGVSDSSMRRFIRGTPPLGADDPLIARLDVLR